MLTFLTESLREALRNVNINRVYELRLRAGKPVVVNYGETIVFLGRLGVTDSRGLALTVCYAEIGEMIARASEYSVYSVTEQLRRGFLTGACGERIGLAGVFVYEDGESFTVKDVTSLNIRVPHEVIGCGGKDLPRLPRRQAAQRAASLAPGRGKTTILRDLARLLGEGGIVNVLIHDERNEISAAEGDFSLNVGPFCDVIRYSQKQDAFTAAVRALRPDVLITDELVSDGEMCAAAACVRGGVEVIASAHCRDIGSLRASPRLCPRRARAHLRAVRRAAGGGDRPRRRHLRRRSAPRSVGMLKALLCIAAFGLCVCAALLLDPPLSSAQGIFLRAQPLQRAAVQRGQLPARAAVNIHRKIRFRRRFPKDAAREEGGGTSAERTTALPTSRRTSESFWETIFG